MNAKYIIVNGVDNLDYPYIFSPIVSHSHFFRNVPIAGVVVSAGFVSFGDGGIVCYGKSVTLDIKSRGKEDDAIFAKCYQI